MASSPLQKQSERFRPYLTGLGAWALAFGCSVGQGAFVMPGSIFLPVAGPVGSAIGITLGMLVMLVLAWNYHFLMNRYPDSGGTYTFIKRCFGYDYGFLGAWFLVLTYTAILWANASALPVVARTLLGTAFQFGFHYEIAGFQIWFGEILLSTLALGGAAFLCLRKTLAIRVQIGMGFALLLGVVLCFVGALTREGASAASFSPAFSKDSTPLQGIFTILAVTPWAFAGFESISHSAGEARFPMKHVFRILMAALIASAVAYIALVLLAVTAAPEGVNGWSSYVARLENYTGVEAQPTFYAAQTALGTWGKALLGVAAVCGIFTGLVGNYIALSRLLVNLSEDRVMPQWIGKLDRKRVPRRAILCILGISAILPFFGRTWISWIVDVTTVGATIAYALTSAAAWKTAREEGDRAARITGMAGFLLSLLFALAFLVPSLVSVTTLSTESYLILAAWGLLGFVAFLFLLWRDQERRFGRSNVALIVLLGLILFASMIWMRQAADYGIGQSAAAARDSYSDQINTAITRASTIQMVLIVLTLILLFVIYGLIQKREKQIEIEKALAENTSRAKTSFLSNMSHEIRTPINAIIGLDNIALRSRELHPQTRDQLEKIGASAQHLLGLINDILDMTRIESGKMVLKNEEFSFREFLDQINIMISSQCADKGLHYTCTIAGQAADYYVGDSMKLKQVLINILGNAVKFTDAPGEVSLTVRQIAQFEGHSTLRFQMRDTGVGMDAEFLPKIFDSFSQEDVTTTNRYGGSGLGMAITKNYVEMMHGDIQVESKKFVGSVFTVTVTLQSSARVAQTRKDARLPEGLRAIVAEDDEVSCDHALGVLRSLGIETSGSRNPDRALAAIRKAAESGQAFDLLLVAAGTPGMDGLALTRAVRTFDGGSTTILLLTDYSAELSPDEARSAGADGTLAKPLFAENLLRALETIRQQKQGGPLPESAPADTPAQTLAGKRVLMAEDVEQNAEILADLLGLEDIDSEHALNGELAVAAFAEHPAGYYDAILMDVRMPVLDGLSATRAIRALDRPDAKTIPIIAMTANVFDEDVEESLQAGMNAHLTKPIDPDCLYETMARLIAEAEQES